MHDLVYNLKNKKLHWCCASNLIHFRPANIYTHTNGRQIVDFIGKVENIHTDWKKIRLNLGIPYSRLPYITTTHKKNDFTKNRKMLMENTHHDANTLQIVEYIYLTDFELFNYKFIA